jgi:hypothetical protein
MPLLNEKNISFYSFRPWRTHLSRPPFPKLPVDLGLAARPRRRSSAPGGVRPRPAAPVGSRPRPCPTTPSGARRQLPSSVTPEAVLVRSSRQRPVQQLVRRSRQQLTRSSPTAIHLSAQVKRVRGISFSRFICLQAFHFIR